MTEQDTHPDAEYPGVEMDNERDVMADRFANYYRGTEAEKSVPNVQAMRDDTQAYLRGAALETAMHANVPGTSIFKILSDAEKVAEFLSSGSRPTGASDGADPASDRTAPDSATSEPTSRTTNEKAMEDYLSTEWPKK
jgi:hypothetical protein